LAQKNLYFLWFKLSAFYKSNTRNNNSLSFRPPFLTFLDYLHIKCTLPKRACTILLLSICTYIFIPVTRRVKGYTRFVGKYVTGRRKRFRPHKVYILLIRITSRVDLAMSVCPSVRLSVRPDERWDLGNYES